MALITQTAKLNLVPGITPPVTVHVSYGDTSRTIKFELIGETVDYVIPTGTTITVHGTRRDGGHFGPFPCTYTGNVVSFNLSSEMTYAEGSAIAELVLKDSNTDIIGTANFAIYCEEAAFPLGVAYENDKSVYEDILTYVQNTVIPSGSVTIDANLNVEGAAADAKATGDAIALKANIASPNFTGTPRVPTAATDTNTTQIASTEFVQNGLALKSNIASPNFTGTPTAPTAATGTNTTQIASTAFVQQELATTVNFEVVSNTTDI